MNTLTSNIFTIVNAQPNHFIDEQRFEVLSQNLKFKLKFYGFSELHLSDDFSTFNQVLFADDKSSLVIIRPLINNCFSHTIINALTRDGLDQQLLNEILDIFIFDNLQLAS